MAPVGVKQEEEKEGLGVRQVYYNTESWKIDRNPHSQNLSGARLLL